MDAPTKTFREKTAKHLIKHLGKRGMEASYAPTIGQAKAEVLAMIPSPASVIRCGSESVGGMGLWADVAALPGVSLIDPYEPGITPQEGMDRRTKGLLADVMIASTNAITLDGKLVNLDGLGNRVAGMCFGPKKVILVVGMNKVVGTLEAAMDRVRTLAAPMNSLRLAAHYPDPKPPCTEDGRCHQCSNANKICNIWVIIEGQKFKDRLHIKLVGEDLGY